MILDKLFAILILGFDHSLFEFFANPIQFCKIWLFRMQYVLVGGTVFLTFQIFFCFLKQESELRTVYFAIGSGQKDDIKKVLR